MIRIRIILLVCVFGLAMLCGCGIYQREEKNDVTLYDSEEIIPALLFPAKEYVEKYGYPTNDNGKTYGPIVWYLGFPDLLLVTDSDGNSGYVKIDEYISMARRNKQSENGSSDEILVYFQDGVTQLGKFAFGK